METRLWAAAVLLAAAVLAAVAVAILSARAKEGEGFEDMGPRNPPAIKPCEVYYTPERAMCDAGGFDVAEATYRARIDALEAKAAPSAAESVELARARASLAAFGTLSGPACKVTLPAPWFRAVSDPDDTVFSDFPDAVHCFVPQADPNDYAPYATSGAVHVDARPFTFGVDGEMATFRRVQFDDAAAATVVGGFYCNLPDVAAARSTDARYDTGPRDAGTLLTFSTRAEGLRLRLLDLRASGAGAAALADRLRMHYDEQLVDDGVVSTLMWIPKFEAGVQVLRLQRDACGAEYASATYSDTCKIGTPVKLRVYRSSPAPVVHGTTKDLLATSAELQAQLKAARAELAAAEELLRKQHRRYDTIMDVLLFMLYHWELQKSGEVQAMSDRAQRGSALEDVSAEATPGRAPALRPAPDAVAAIGGIPVPASMHLGPRPYAFRLVPRLEKPTFTYVSGPGPGYSAQALKDDTEQFITAPAMCPPGSHVTGAMLQVDASRQLSGTAGVHVTVSCRDPENTLYVQSSGGGLTAAELASHRVYRPKTGPDWTVDYPSAELYNFRRNNESKGDPFFKFKASDKDQCFNVCARYGDMCAMANFTAANSGNNCHLHGSVGEHAGDDGNTLNWVKDAAGVAGAPEPKDSNK